MSRVCVCDKTGTGGVPYQWGWCYGCWRFHNPGQPSPFAGGKSPEKPKEAKLEREWKCISLTVQVERRHGCNGMMCRWGCEKGLPAVPAGYCQTCTAYVAEEGAGWLS